MQKILTFILCFGLCLIFFGQYDAHAAGSAKDIKSVNMQGYEELLASHKGKIVVVNFFATWCPPCREEIPGLVSLAQSMPDNVVVIGLSGDEDPSKLPSFLKNMKVNYPVFLAEIDVLQAFRVQTIPHNLIYNNEGKIVANAAGFVTEEELKQFINMLLEEDANAKRDNS